MTPPGGAPRLDGLRVLVPRPAARAVDLVALLRAAGALPIAAPLISTVPELGSGLAREAVRNLAAGAYDWVAFTSAAAVDAIIAIAAESAADSAAAPGIAIASGTPGTGGLVSRHTRVAAVGHGTADALAAANCRVDLLPTGGHSGAALAAAWPDEPAGRSVLLPRSDRARRELGNALRRSGHRVHPVVAYRTELQPLPDSTVRDLASGAIGGVLLTSPSSCEALGNALAGAPLAPTVVTVAIGATTAAAARRSGFAITTVATQASDAGLVAALAQAVGARTRT